jgi:hypothetical protein
MRPIWLSAVALLSVAVLGVAVAGAESSWTDPTGDALGNAPDITAVQVSNDSGGQCLFRVTVSNLTPESALYLYLDTDKNAATGDAGFEYMLSWDSSSDPDANGWSIEHWNGTSWVHPGDHPTMVGMKTTAGVEFSVNRTDLGNAGGFALKAVAPRWTADAVSGMDVAPDGLVTWTYDLAVAPAPPPPASVVKPVFGPARAVPSVPVAGKKFVFTLAVNRSDTGAPLTRGTMVCDPSVAGKVITHAESFTGGKARLAFVVPKTAHGKQLKVKVKIVTGTQSATKVTTYRVK